VFATYVEMELLRMELSFAMMVLKTMKAAILNAKGMLLAGYVLSSERVKLTVLPFVEIYE